MSALENTEIPAIYSGIDKTLRKEKAKQLLNVLGLEAKLNNKPSQLSGGQQQRAVIARAIANKPKILIADEPTARSEFFRWYLSLPPEDAVMEQIMYRVVKK